MPSTWGTLTSTPCLRRAAILARSFFSAASASGALDWANAGPLTSDNQTRAATPRRIAPILLVSWGIASELGIQSCLLTNLVRSDPVEPAVSLDRYGPWPVCVNRVFLTLAQQREAIFLKVLDEILALDG